MVLHSNKNDKLSFKSMALMFLKGIHFTIIKMIKSNNQSKQRPSPPNNPIFKTILLSIYEF